MVYAVMSWGSGFILARLGLGVGKIVFFALFVYSGVVQYMLADIAKGLKSVGSTVSSDIDIIVPTLTAIVLISLRHLFYSIHFSQLVHRMPFWKKILLSSQLTDETYAFKNIFLTKPIIFSEAITVNVLCHLSWVTFSFIGAKFSTYVEDDFTAKLECFNFAVPAMFLALFYFSLQKAFWGKIAFFVAFVSFFLMLLCALFFPFLLGLLLIVISATTAGAFWSLRDERLSKESEKSCD